MTKHMKRNEPTKLVVGHLADKEDNDNWAGTPEDKKLRDESLERELEDDDDYEEDYEEEEEEDREVKTAVAEKPVEKPEEQRLPEELDQKLKQIDDFQKDIPTLIEALKKKLQEINDKREELDEEETRLKKRINFLRVMTGMEPEEGVEEDDVPKKNEGKKPRGGRRYKNKYPLKEFIMHSMLGMKHPKTGEENSGYAKDIANKVLKDGYKTDIKSPTGTIRKNLRDLEEEGFVRHSEDTDDDIYTLKRKAIAFIESQKIEE